MEQQFDIAIDLSNQYDDIKKLSKKEYKKLLKKINIKEDIKNQNKIPVLNYIYIEYTRNNLKRLIIDKIFALNIDSENKFVIEILDFLLKECQIEDIRKDITYFQSKRNLAYLSEDIYFLSQERIKIIKNSNSSLLRNLLFRVDNSFFRRNEYREILDISVEDLSEICSTLVYLYLQIHGENIISEKTFSNTDKDVKKVDLLINYQFLIKQFQDVEKLIDNFNYICIKDKNNIILKPYDELLEKARQYGYNHSIKQRYIDGINNITSLKENNIVISLYKIIDELFSNDNEYIFKLLKEPIERYTFNLQFIFEKIWDYIVQNDFNFLEEILEIDEIIREYFDNNIRTLDEIDEVMKFTISDNLTLKDLLRAKRVFIIIARLNSKFLYSVLEKDSSKKDIVYNSWIKSFKYNELVNILQFIIGKDKAKEFIGEFHWSLNEKRVLDLQYTPLIKLDDYYFPMNIFINSDLFRNSLFKNNIRPQKVKPVDIIGNNIFRALNKNFKYVAQEIKFKKNGIQGDFDVIAYIDNIVYIFECKNTINPADLHELRTTYKDNLQHGFEQLSKCKNMLFNREYIKILNNQFKWDLSNNFKIVTCLVMSTRMFNGYTNGGHHVISDKELLKFLENGKIKVYNNKKIELRLWENDKITGNDIFNFIENRILSKIVFSCFYPKEDKFSFGKNNLIFKTFEFKNEGLNQKFIDRFKEIK